MSTESKELVLDMINFYRNTLDVNKTVDLYAQKIDKMRVYVRPKKQDIRLSEVEKDDIAKTCMSIIVKLYDVPEEDINSGCRKRYMVEARYAYINLLRYVMGAKSMHISRLIGKHHSTIIYAFDLYETLVMEKGWLDLYNFATELIDKYCEERGIVNLKEDEYIKYKVYRLQ